MQKFSKITGGKRTSDELVVKDAEGQVLCFTGAESWAYFVKYYIATLSENGHSKVVENDPLDVPMHPTASSW